MRCYEEFIDCIVALKGVDQVLERNAIAFKYHSAAENLRIGLKGGASRHVQKIPVSR